MIIEPGFLEHWKTRLLCQRLEDESAPLRLLKLWEHCQMRKAWIFPFSPDILKAVCGWKGEPKPFWEAMTDEHGGWLIPAEEGRWEVRGFCELNGKLTHNWRVGKIPKGQGKSVGNGQNHNEARDKPNSTHTQANGKPETSQVQPTHKPTGSQKQAKSDPAPPLGQPHSIALHSIAEHSDISVASARPLGRKVHGDDTEPAWPERIYAAYPRKVGKSDALRSIARVLQKKEKGGRVMHPAELLGIVGLYAAAVEAWPEDQRQFIPHPATWFNAGRYLDDPSEWTREDSPQKKEVGARFERPEKPAVAIRIPRIHRDLPPPDCDWRAVLKDLYPPEDYPSADYSMEWGLYDPEQREQVVRECIRLGQLPNSWKQSPLQSS